MFRNAFRSLCISLFVVVCLSSHAQTKLTQFSTDTTKFTRDLNQYFQDNSANKVQAADYIREFEKLWKENVVAGYFKEIVMETSNTMLAKRMKPYPYFIGYLNTVVNAIVAKQSNENFQNWQACVDKLLKGKSMRGAQDFLDMSENIFKNNTFYKTPSYRYYSVEPNYKICI